MEVNKFLVITGSLVLFMISMTTGQISGVERGGSTLPTRDGPITFTNVSREVGLSHINGDFFSWGDFDNDDHQDLLVDGKRLFRNTGPPEYVFSDVTVHAGIDRPVNSGVFGDYDNDGWLDIFCGGGYGTRDHPKTSDILWRNNRDGTFTDVTSTAGGLSDTFPTVAGGWADVDRDGYIDLYMVNYENTSLHGYPDNFWYNNGDGTFRNGTVESGMDESGDPLPGRGISFSDFDNDGFIDAYISNYRITPNYLYHNDRDGAMEEAAAQFGVEGHGNDHPVTQEGPYYGHSLGSSWGDLDNDGDMDLWVTNLAHKDAWRGPICDDSYLFENQGFEDGYMFMDVREASGIPVKSIPGAVFGDGDELMVSSAMADYDNDGDLDLFIPQTYNLSYADSFMYSNDGDMTFTDVSDESGIHVWNTYGSAWCDYNEDGWIDLVTGGYNWDEDVGIVDGSIHLFKNNGLSIEPERNWLEVSLKGRESNNDAIGTRVTTEVDTDGDGSFDLSMIREVSGGTATHGQQDSMTLHFGLGESVMDIRVTTRWPMGKEVVMTGIEPNSIVDLFEPTEPVTLNISLTNFEMDTRATVMDLTIDNPTSFPISYTEFVMDIEENGHSTEYLIVHEDRIRPGGNKITLHAPGLPEETIANITMVIGRSFPPIENEPVVNHYHDPLTNLMPIPLIDGPNEVMVGEEFVIDGTGSYDKDGGVASYIFDLGDGTISGWQGAGTFSHSYPSGGRYGVRLSVMDDRGGISVEDAVLEITATGMMETAPVAEIDYIEPMSAEIGERIRMKGHGIPSGGRSIIGYEWSSSIDGIIGDTAYISIESLSSGTHSITFRVIDSEDEWSKPVKRDMEVTETLVEELWVTIDPPSIEGPYSGPVKFTGSAGPNDRVEFVEVRVDSGQWEKARTVPEWYFEVDCRYLDPGNHRIDARCFGDRYYSNSYSSLEFEVVSEIEEEPKGTILESKDEGLMDILTLPLVLIIGSIAVFVLISIVSFFVIIVLMRRKNVERIRGYAVSENTFKGPESLNIEKDNDDLQVIKATVIE